MGRLFAVVAAVALLASNGAAADQQQVLDNLDFQSGTVTVGTNLATVALTPNFRYLGPDGAKAFLVDLWGNPPEAAEGALGLITPADVDPLSPDGWAIIVSYDDSGHVSDEDAADIDYDQLLKDMQASTAENNEARKKAGYESIQLVGWAKPPFYDSEAKKLYWAKRLKFEGSQEDTLNYDIRVLGRVGVLDLTVVAGMPQLAMVDSRMNEVLGMVSFNIGNRYAEFNPELDKVAGYGIAGLIAGGVLAKAGFFKFLIALWKPIAFGAVILFAGIGGLVRKMRNREAS
ncbi:MAG: DUF2167 domain-containing protein [Dongiaceae bacterium]